IPLDDIDRLPWLRAVGQWQAAHAATGAVISCSALKRSYRDILRAAAPHQLFVHLDGTPEVVAARVARRPGHFMPASLVRSQFATLEPLQPDENGLVIDLDQPLTAIVDAYLLAVASVETEA